LPEHVSEIEQERVKYLTLAYNQFNKWLESSVPVVIIV
jgi:hypothetical protein